MSTVPEIVAARHCGIRVIAFSLVTNNAVLSPVPRGDDHLLEGKKAKDLDVLVQEGKANHQDVIEAAHSAALDMEVSHLKIQLKVPNNNFENRLSSTKSLKITSGRINEQYPNAQNSLM